VTRSKKLIRNSLIIIVLGILLFRMSGLYLTPLQAHEKSELGANYGPSKIAHVEDFKYGKYYLGKYDKWFSCNTVKRELGLFWRFGSNVYGKENDTTKAIDFSWQSTRMQDKMYTTIYGVINDSKVKKVEVTRSDGEVLTQTEFYDDMFLFHYESVNDLYMKSIKAYDEDNKLIFEKAYS